MTPVVDDTKEYTLSRISPFTHLRHLELLVKHKAYEDESWSPYDPEPEYSHCSLERIASPPSITSSKLLSIPSPSALVFMSLFPSPPTLFFASPKTAHILSSSSASSAQIGTLARRSRP
ncbi:hypothetical protein JCM11641_007701 [Rhodosporidiobolus odoratus]